MNLHVACPHTHETGPPHRLTDSEIVLCAKYFDFTDLVQAALEGDTEARESLQEDLAQLAQDAEHDNDARKLLNLLARNGFAQEQKPRPVY